MNKDDMIKYLTGLTDKYKVASCNTYTAPTDKDIEKGISLNLFQQ